MPEPTPPTPPSERHEEFVTLLTTSQPKLLGYLMSLLGRWHDAEDVLQRATLLMWQKFSTFERGTDFVAWACTICFYEARNFQRVAARSALRFPEELLETLALERQEDLPQRERRLAALELCLAQLREKERALLQAAYAQHGGVLALAAQLGRAPRTLYNQLHQLRRMLAQCVLRRLGEEAA